MARLRTVTSIVLASGLVVGVVGAAASSIRTTRVAEARILSNRAERSATVFDRGRTAVMLARVNITPKTMAAAGLSVLESQQVIGRMMIHLAAINSNGQIEAATRTANAADAPSLPTATPTAAPTPATSPTPAPPAADNPQTKPSAPQARASINGMLDLAFTFAVQELPASKQEQLVNLRQNARWELPLPFAVVPPSTRTDQEWLRLKAAIAHVGAAAQDNRQPSPGPLGVFNAADGDTRVSTARTNLAANLTGIQQAWDDLLADQ